MSQTNKRKKVSNDIVNVGVNRIHGILILGAMLILLVCAVNSCSSTVQAENGTEKELSYSQQEVLEYKNPYEENMSNYTAMYTVSRLNVRREADIDSEIIGILEKNEFVCVMEEKNGWAKILYGSDYGYVSYVYLKSE